VKWPVGILAGTIIGVGITTLDSESRPEIMVELETGLLPAEPGNSSRSSEKRSTFVGYYRALVSNAGEKTAQGVWLTLPSASLVRIDKPGEEPLLARTARTDLGELHPGRRIVVHGWTAVAPDPESARCGHLDGPGEVLLPKRDTTSSSYLAVGVLLGFFVALVLALLVAEFSVGGSPTVNVDP
jgi:hypothetical protein